MRGSSSLERTIDHVFKGVLVVITISLFSVLSDLRTKVAVTNEQVAGLRDRVDSFRVMAGDRYTGAQASRDLATMNAINNDQEARLRALERSGSDIRVSP